MRYILAIATLAVASVSAVLAETVTFESDDSILIVRGRDMYGSAVFELVANGDAPIQCIALDMSGKPLAVATPEAQASGEKPLDRESTVWLSWADNALILLPHD